MKKLLIAALLTASFSSHGTDMPGYDFHYTVSGAGNAKPVQVFDDGKHMYLQFRRPSVPPVMFINTPSGPVLVTPRQQFPFWVLDSLTPEVVMRMGMDQATVHYNGGRSLPALPGGGGQMTGAAMPQQIASAAEIPSDTEVRTQPAYANESAMQFTRHQFSGEMIFEPEKNPDQARAVVVTTAVAETAPRVQPVSYRASGSSEERRDGHYVVRAGDNASRIALRHHIRLADLIAANDLRKPYIIRVGQILVLPGGGEIKRLSMQVDAKPAAVRHATGIAMNSDAVYLRGHAEQITNMANRLVASGVSVGKINLASISDFHAHLHEPNSIDLVFVNKGFAHA